MKYEAKVEITSITLFMQKISFVIYMLMMRHTSAKCRAALALSSEYWSINI